MDNDGGIVQTMIDSAAKAKIETHTLGRNISVLGGSGENVAARALLMLLSVGVLYALTQWFIILAYRHASAAELSPFNYSVVVFSGILGWIFFANVPGLSALAGTLLICAGGILSIHSGHPEGKGSWFGAGHWHWPWKLASRMGFAYPIRIPESE
jgi:uncharacterized membrane protein